MVQKMMWRSLLGVFLLTTVWIGGAEEVAAIEPEVEEEIASLTTGPIVRRQLLHRSGRFEVQPMAAFTLNDPFIRNTLPGISGTFFLNNVFGLGATFNFGVLHLDTNLRQNLEETLGEAGVQSRNLTYSKIGWTLDAGLVYVPLFGKFSVMNSFFTHYDLHLMGGMAMISETAEAARETIVADDGLSGVRPGGMVGVGLRFFLGDMVSLNFQMRNYIATRAKVSSGAASAQLGNTVLLSAGVGIYFPGEVRISR